MPVAISVENLSKQYLISHQRRERYTALRDTLATSVKSFGERLLHAFSGNGSSIDSSPIQEKFWALKDLNFDIQQGDCVGIIGRNGAGKSTLLKVLSRVTEPTSGRVRITGRLASLLEVGTGFHPELTGSENIYLNGAILGMSRSEIKRKFDEIVDFAEVERFLDTPVKRFSSGMYMRLAFAVAAHIEPEILIVDEVLAVGDAQFQKKCMGKMESVGREGRTVLFVSHNMSAIASLCGRAFLIQNGQLVADTDVSNGIRRYLSAASDHIYDRGGGADTLIPCISKAWFETVGGEAISQIETGESLCLVMEIKNPGAIALEIALSFWDPMRRPIWNFTHAMHGLPPLPNAARIRSRVTFHPPKLTVSELIADLAIGPKGGGSYFDHAIGAIRLAIVDSAKEVYRERYSNWPIFCEATLESDAEEQWQR